MCKQVLSKRYGRPYAATYLSKNQAALLESGPLELSSSDRMLTLELYEATQGINTRLCFESPTNCPYRTRGILQTDGRVWKTITWPVPQ
uniref:Uncharacterized protein n=1 Tax=Romanomermis culicivorax TaxID=13658 RepID=A0A915KJ60_ROMCU